MTTHEVQGDYPIYKIDYWDPAGSFGGWFLHVVPSGLTLVYGGSPPTLVGIDTNIVAEPTYDADTGLPEPLKRSGLLFREGIVERLKRMFGTDCSVRWKATLVESVTPAVVDIDF